MLEFNELALEVGEQKAPSAASLAVNKSLFFFLPLAGRTRLLVKLMLIWMSYDLNGKRNTPCALHLILHT